MLRVDRSAPTLRDRLRAPLRPLDTRDLLRRFAEDEIIPRLYARRIATGDTGGAAPRDLPSCETLLADLLGPAPDAALTTWNRTFRTLGEAASLHLMTDAARLLGQQWAEDARSFADVTVATLHLHALLRGLAPAHAPASGPGRPRCLLTAVPGEQHGFGVAMLAHVFRDRGWQARIADAADTGELAALAVRLAPDMVGLSAAADMHLSRLARAVAAIRRAVPGTLVMVGGPVFLARPELAARVGADATAPDAASAVAVAEGLLLRARAAAPRIPILA